MACGSILTSSASGSWKRRAMEIAPRIVTSKSGNSCIAMGEAEYTDAPASLTTIARQSKSACAISSFMSVSVSRDAVPLPMAAQPISYCLISLVNNAHASCVRFCGP